MYPLHTAWNSFSNTWCSEAGEKAEHFYDEAKATAEKVGEFISKEAEELGDHAKEARKRYVFDMS